MMAFEDILSKRLGSRYRSRRLAQDEQPRSAGGPQRVRVPQNVTLRQGPSDARTPRYVCTDPLMDRSVEIIDACRSACTAWCGSSPRPGAPGGLDPPDML